MKSKDRIIIQKVINYIDDVEKYKKFRHKYQKMVDILCLK